MATGASSSSSSVSSASAASSTSVSSTSSTSVTSSSRGSTDGSEGTSGSGRMSVVSAWPRARLSGPSTLGRGMQTPPKVVALTTEPADASRRIERPSSRFLCLETMCGIAGYSLGLDSRVERTVAARALLAGIAERGADAVGYAFRRPGSAITLHKQRSGATALLDRIEVPEPATQLLVHVRDYTKGHPSLSANNHPIRHGGVVGIHNGLITNDDKLFDEHGIPRAEAGMTVDSEIIFAIAERSRGRT